MIIDIVLREQGEASRLIWEVAKYVAVICNALSSKDMLDNFALLKAE